MYQGAGGFWSELWDGVKATAQQYFAPEVISAVTRAFASPSQANIAAVQAAFREQGTTPPPELMNALYERYADAIRRNPFAYGGGLMQQASDFLPLILGGFVLIWVVSRKR